MRPGSWLSILTVYTCGVLAVVTLVVMIPLQGDFVLRGGFSIEQFGLVIGSIGLSAALLASVGGSLVDRFGSRNVLLVCAAIMATANVCHFFVDAFPLHLAARLAEGAALSAILAAGPAYIIETTSDRRRLTAMTIWSTATPVAATLGMVLGGMFADRANWRDVFLFYAIALAMGGLCAAALPRLSKSDTDIPSLRKQIQALGAGFRNSNAVRLGTLLLLISASSLGLSTVLPGYLARVHGVSVGEVAQLVAIGNLGMIPGALLLGPVLSRGIAARHILTCLTAGAIASAALVLNPQVPLTVAAGLFGAWSLFVGAGSGLVFVALPRIADPAAPGLATGVVNQLATFANFVAPLLFLSTIAMGWPILLAVIAALWSTAVLAFWKVGGPSG